MSANVNKFSPTNSLQFLWYLYIPIILFSSSCSNITTKRFLKENGFSTPKITEKQIGVAEYEITNKQFRTFLKDGNFTKFRYDSLQWLIKTDTNDAFKPMSENYHWHPAFDDYPIVNITYEAATAYCLWLTENYIKMSGKTDILFRLPSSDELDKLLQERIYLLKGDQFEVYDCKYIDNFKYKSRNDDGDHLSVDAALATISVEKYKQDVYYSILGNVSEICQDGIIKGGNWFTYPSEIMVKKDYSLPDPRVGFRIVIEKRN